MKNLKVVALGIALISNTLVFSQKQTKMSVEEKADKITNKLTEELDLSSNQTNEVKSLNLETISEQRKIRSNNSLSKEEKKNQTKALRKMQKEKLNSILTEEQMTKLKELRVDKKGKKKNISPAEKASKMTAKLDETVTLSPSQKNEVKAVNLHAVVEMNKIKKDESLSEEDKKMALKNVRKQKKEKIKSILNKEQLSKLKAAKKARK